MHVITWMGHENIKWENLDTKDHIWHFFHMWNVQNGQIQPIKAEVRVWLSGASKKRVRVGGKWPLCAKEHEVSFQGDEIV